MTHRVSIVDGDRRTRPGRDSAPAPARTAAPASGRRTAVHR
ncbi:hypothetical protein ACVCAH_10565 [Micromonospora sp. LZ34]